MNPACCTFSDFFNICRKSFHLLEFHSFVILVILEIIHEFLTSNIKIVAVQIVIIRVGKRMTDEEKLIIKFTGLYIILCS